MTNVFKQILKGKFAKDLRSSAIAEVLDTEQFWEEASDAIAEEMKKSTAYIDLYKGRPTLIVSLGTGGQVPIYLDAIRLDAGLFYSDDDESERDIAREIKGLSMLIDVLQIQKGHLERFVAEQSAENERGQ